MKKKLSKIFLFITIAAIVLLSAVIASCPTENKTEDKGPTTTTTIIAWSGTYSGSEIGSLSINQLPENKVEGKSSSPTGSTTNFSGTSTLSNNSFTGTFSGVTSSNINITLQISGTISGSSMTGTYITKQNNTAIDRGTFSLTKQ